MFWKNKKGSSSKSQKQPEPTAPKPAAAAMGSQRTSATTTSSSLTMGRTSLLSTSSATATPWRTSLLGSAGPPSATMTPAATPVAASTNNSPLHVNVITPTNTNLSDTSSGSEQERRSASASPSSGDRQSMTQQTQQQQRLPPPIVLERQPSDVSAWVSEVDSHYHSDIEDSEDEESMIGGPNTTTSAHIMVVDQDDASAVASRRSLALSEVDSQGVASSSVKRGRGRAAAPPPRIVTTNTDHDRGGRTAATSSTVQPQQLQNPVVHTVSPHEEDRHHPIRAFIVSPEQQQQRQQAGGDDTSEDTRKSRRRYFGRSPGRKKKQAAETSNSNDPDASSAAVLLTVWQQRASQAEERASSVTHRLALEERLHRQVAEDLREATWETSHLEDQIHEQTARIHELEQQQRITQEWSNTTKYAAAPATTLDVDHRLQLACVTAEQERTQKQLKELIRDLKRSQDKLLRVEHQKMQLLRELAELQATQTDQRALASAPRYVVDQQQTQNELQDQVQGLQAEVSQLTSSRDALAQEKELLVAENEKTLQNMSQEFAGLEAERDALLEQTQSMKVVIEALTSDKALVEEKLSQTLQALAASEEQLAGAKADVSKANSERCAALMQKKELEAKYGVLSKRMEAFQEDFEKIVSEKQALSDERDTVKSELECTLAEFQDLQSANRKTLVHHVELESKNEELQAQLEKLEGQASTLLKELESLGSEKAQLSSTNGILVKEKTHQLASIDNEKDALRARLVSLETEKTIVAIELSASQARISELEDRVKTIQCDAEQSIQKQVTFANDISRLQKEKSSLLLRVSAFESELVAVRDELKVSKVAAADAMKKLLLSEEEKASLGDEKAAAVARQIELKAEVEARTAKLTSMESISSGLEEQIRVISEEKRVLVEKENQALASVGFSRKEEANLKEAVASATKTISQLQKENAMMASRLSSSEAAFAALQDQVETKDETNQGSLKKLGQKILGDNETMRKMAEELKASKQDNKGLKRAARYLVKRLREMETHVGIEGRTIDLSFDLASTPDSKRSRQLQHSPMLDDCVDTAEDSTDTVRVAQQEVTLEMYYHDKQGDLQTYQVRVKYTGPAVDGVPEGPGMLRFDNGDMFLGEFSAGEMDGVGAFAHRQRHRHANQIFFGKFSHNEFKGDIKDAPPIERVTVQHRPKHAHMSTVVDEHVMSV
jgi:chromosome segregation ATPase